MFVYTGMNECLGVPDLCSGGECTSTGRNYACTCPYSFSSSLDGTHYLGEPGPKRLEGTKAGRDKPLALCNPLALDSSTPPISMSCLFWTLDSIPSGILAPYLLGFVLFGP